MIIVASTKAKQLSEAAGRVKRAFEVITDSGGNISTGETKNKTE